MLPYTLRAPVEPSPNSVQDPIDPEIRICPCANLTRTTRIKSGAPACIRHDLGSGLQEPPIVRK